MKKYMLIFGFFLFAFSTTNAQTFEEYKKEQERKQAEFAKNRDNEMSKLYKQYKEYVEKRNLEYSKFLQQKWEEKEQQPEEHCYDNKKPVDIPVLIPTDEPRKETEMTNAPVVIPISIPYDTAYRKPRPVAVPPVIDIPTNNENIKTIKIDLYGLALEIPVDKSFINLKTEGNTEKDIANWFSKVSKTNHLSVTKYINDIMEKTNLNDWGRYLITQKIAETLVADNQSQTLYIWFILLQSEYDVRLARQGENISLLIPFHQSLYEVPYITFDKQNYYLIGSTAENSIYTYEHKNKDFYKKFDLNFSKQAQVAPFPSKSTLNFVYDNKEYNLDLEYDPILVQILSTQPQPYITTYFSSNASVYLSNSANKSIELLLANLPEQEAVNLLLRMVQTAFAYKTDTEHFGKQKFMYPDEVIHYPYTDCDDRAVLFAWLVKNYTHQKVAALLYPGHLSTAVHFPKGNPKGDKLKVEYKEFVVSDPTYINADIGQTMPQFKNTNPTGWIVK
jgi:hypothetical protein